MSIPLNIQLELWQHSIKYWEDDCRKLWRQHPHVPESIRMLVTTVMVRYAHETTLAAIQGLPPTEWAAAVPEKELDTFRGLLLTWVDPMMQQVFDSLLGMNGVQEAFDRAQAYRAELQQQFPASEHKDALEFLVETDRRWFQNNYEQLESRKHVLDRLRKVNLQVLQESVEARQQADQMLARFKGFAKRATQAQKRHSN